LSEGSKSILIAVREETHIRSLSAADCRSFDAVDCRLSVLSNEFTSVIIYRLTDHAVRQKTSLHLIFPEWRPTFPIVPKK